MGPLYDDVLLIIFKELSLNERAKLRLINHHWKNLIDSIQINKLIIFEKLTPVEGHLEFTNEPYAIKDTACARNLKSFFINQIVQKQIKNIKILVIHGLYSLVDLPKFDDLTFLWLIKIRLSNSEILKSPSIQHLIIDHTYFRPIETINLELKKQKKKISISSESFPFCSIYGLTDLESKKIKYLNLKYRSTLLGFYTFFENQFNCIQEIRTNNVLPGLETLVYLNKNYLSLKKIDFRFEDGIIGESRDDNRLKEIANQLRDDLEVSLFGIPFNKSTHKLFINFISQLNNKLQIMNCRTVYGILELICDNFIYDLLNKFDNTILDLNQFYQSIDLFTIKDLNLVKIDENFFERFKNCKRICLSYSTVVPDSNLKKIFNHFRNLKGISIHLNINLNEFEFDSSIFDSIVQNHFEIDTLVIRITKRIDFNFLLKFQKLTSLKLILNYSFDQILLIDLLNKLEFLVDLEISFIRPDTLTRIDLISLKRKIDKTFKQKFEINNLLFSIVFCENRIVKYLLLRRISIEQTSYKGFWNFLFTSIRNFLIKRTNWIS